MAQKNNTTPLILSLSIATMGFAATSIRFTTSGLDETTYMVFDVIGSISVIVVTNIFSYLYFKARWDIKKGKETEQ